MFRNNFHHHQEDNRSPNKNSKLQAVFGKLSGVLPRAQDLANSNHKTMSSDIIESVLTDSPLPVPTSYNYEQTTYNNISSSEQNNFLCLTITTISNRLEFELRQSKHTLLECGEVLLPCGLLYHISRDILSMAESEPCGIRGCLIHLNFEGINECRKLKIIKCDPSTATTFELNLILKQHYNTWNFIPQFLKNLARGRTIVVSPAYTLSKKKLYRSILE